MSTYSIADSWKAHQRFNVWIACFVAVIHAIFLLGLIMISYSASKIIIPQKQPVRVQTIRLQEPKPVASMPAPVVIEEAPIEIAKAEPLTVVNQPAPESKKETASPPKPIPKKESPKPVKKSSTPLKKIEAKKPKIQPQKKVEKKPTKVKEEKLKGDIQQEKINAKKRELLAAAKESIAKIDQTRNKAMIKCSSEASISSITAPIGALQIDALPMLEGETLSKQEIGYRDELAHRLKLLLRLPEFGEVKMKLTLLRTGKVSKIEITNAENQANRSYVERILPSLAFPPFGDQFNDQSQYTFLITLRNEI
jgi:hypothetical protein